MIYVVKFADFIIFYSKVVCCSVLLMCQKFDSVADIWWRIAKRAWYFEQRQSICWVGICMDAASLNLFFRPGLQTLSRLSYLGLKSTPPQSVVPCRPTAATKRCAPTAVTKSHGSGWRSGSFERCAEARGPVESRWRHWAARARASRAQDTKEFLLYLELWPAKWSTKTTYLQVTFSAGNQNQGVLEGSWGITSYPWDPCVESSAKVGDYVSAINSRMECTEGLATLQRL